MPVEMMFNFDKEFCNRLEAVADELCMSPKAFILVSGNAAIPYFTKPADETTLQDFREHMRQAVRGTVDRIERALLETKRNSPAK